MKTTQQLGPWSYLGIFLAPLALGALAIHSGLSPTLASLLSMGVLALVLNVLEPVYPARTEWQRAGHEVSVDAMHLGVGSALAGVLHQSAIRLGAGLLGGKNQLWPGTLPVVCLVVLALCVIELGQYVAHYFLHRVSLLWRFHAIHHSPQRLYWLNTFRNHPIDTLFTVVLPMVPLVLLGTSELVIILAGLIVGLHGMMQHTNLCFREGILTYVLSSASLHRWHHDRDLRHAQGNYGGTLILWDLLFGTRVAPDKEGPTNIGLAGADPIREDYLEQLVYPFRRRRTP